MCDVPDLANFLDRLNRNEEIKEKECLANQIINDLIRPGDKVFLAVGTTVYLIAKKLITKVSDLKISTNCVPIAYLFLQLQRQQRLAENVELEILGGKVNAATSVIDHTKSKVKLNSKILVWTPHGITSKGLLSEHHATVTEELVTKHDKVIIPLTYSKLGRSARDVVKHLGWMSKQVTESRKQYIIVLPQTLPSGVPKAKIQRWKELVAIFKEKNLTILTEPTFLK